MARHPDKRIEVLNEEALQALGETLAPVEVSEQRRESMRRRIMSRLADTPPLLTETIRPESIAWQNIAPGAQAKVLKRDDSAGVIIVLWRLVPGGVIPGHSHTEDENEECLVLEGEMLVGSHRVKAGELHIAKRGAIHADLTTRTGCLVMVRSAISPALSNWFPAS